MKSFGLDGRILLTGCTDSFFMLHVQMWFSEEMRFDPSLCSSSAKITSKITLFLKMARMTSGERIRHFQLSPSLNPILIMVKR